MIVDYEWVNGKVLLSYINKKGNLKFKNYPFKNIENWVVTNDNDPMRSRDKTTWDGKPIKKERDRYPNRYTLYEFLHNLPQEEQEEIFAYNEPKIAFCDIEVEITHGFPEAHIAENRVTAISIIQDDTIVLMGIKDISNKDISKMEKDINDYFTKFNTKYKLNWIFYESEKEMLTDFFNDIVPKLPVLTGWNFVEYDWVYLVTRARRLNIDPAVASPTRTLVKPWRNDKEQKIPKPIYEELPMHRLVFDYMDVYRKWDRSVKIKESDTLDYVSSQMLGVKKLEYDGSLKDLYENNYYDYMLYNCIDTVLVQLIHLKSRLFDNMLSISNIANVEIKNAMSEVRVVEGLFFKPYFDYGIVMVKEYNNVFDESDDKKDEEEADKILKGGYVKYPSVGLIMWIAVFDFASLYPTTMRQYNIGPETFRGIKVNDNISILNGKEYKIKPNDIILDNGAVFIAEDGITKKKITELYFGRKTSKNTGQAYDKHVDLLQHYLLQRA